VPEPQGPPTPNELVFAVAHEIGNHLGGIRLQAHLIDEDLAPHALAESTVAIDDLAGRAGPLLALLRPILGAEYRSASGATWSSLLRGLALQLEEEGTRGVRVGIEPPSDCDLEPPDVEWLDPLLMALIGSTLAQVPARGGISLRIGSRGGETALVVEDDGVEEDLSAGAALRGRALVVGIARALVDRLGGGVEVERVAERTTVALVLPNGS
jgi:hypothetical protein